MVVPAVRPSILNAHHHSAAPHRRCGIPPLSPAPGTTLKTDAAIRQLDGASRPGRPTRVDSRIDVSGRPAMHPRALAEGAKWVPRAGAPIQATKRHVTEVSRTRCDALEGGDDGVHTLTRKGNAEAAGW